MYLYVMILMEYSHIARNLWILKQFTSLDQLCSDQDVLQKIDDMIGNEWAEEIARGNKRWIDKFFFDIINIYSQPKTYIFDWFMWKTATSTPCYSVIWDKCNSITQLDEKYFNYTSEKKKELIDREKELPSRRIDESLSDSIRWIIYQTISRYPELRNVWISFVAVNGFTIMPNRQHVMRSQVNFLDLVKELFRLQTKEKRWYVIQINTIEKEWVMVLHKLTDFSIWGVMTHELAHTLDYTHKTVWWMLLFLLAFAICPRRVRHMERKIDETAIARWSWYALYTFRREVHAGSSEQYAKYKRRAYLWPKQILYGILKYNTMYSPEILENVCSHILSWEY